MRPLDTALARAVRELTAQPDVRRAARIGHHLHLAERAPTNAGVQRLEARFLRRKARRERVDPVDTLRARGQLCRRERLILDLVQRTRPTRDLDNVQSDADDQATLIGPRAARVAA